MPSSIADSGGRGQPGGRTGAQRDTGLPPRPDSQTHKGAGTGRAPRIPLQTASKMEQKETGRRTFPQFKFRSKNVKASFLLFISEGEAVPGLRHQVPCVAVQSRALVRSAAGPFSSLATSSAPAPSPLHLTAGTRGPQDHLWTWSPGLECPGAPVSQQPPSSL